MDMGTSTMAMAATATGAVASATSSAISSMHMSMGDGCKISMLWNWYTVDACFIASTWHITSRSMFAGSCIGVILLVVSLEFLRRVSKEYDQYILRQYQRSFLATSISSSSKSPAESITPASKESELQAVKQGNGMNNIGVTAIPPFRPHLVQQLVRATLHMLQFAVAYFIMLLAMYFNGYIIICIIIGAWVGGFVFTWETVNVSAPGGQKQEATYCCG